MKQLSSISFLILIFFFSPATILFAQNEQQHWYMGIGLGLRFNGTNPPAIINNSKMLAPYATAVMSNKTTGKLLFYTDGDKVWNAQHQLMANGSGLLGAACMEVIIVPVPGNDLRYYIFYTSNTGPLYYAEVDMALGGRLGDVVYKKKILANKLESFFTVVKHEYGNGYWLVGHERAGLNFVAFRINESGIDNKPVLSEGLMPTTASNAWKGGQLVASGNGRKIAIGGHNYGAAVDVYGFDKRCGKVRYGSGVYGTCGYANGLAFSPNDSFLYVTSYCPSIDKTKLTQIYLAQTTQPTQIAVTTDALREMRLAPDGKIYIVTSENGAVTSKLDVISKPDQPGNLCGYNKYFLTLHPGGISYFTEYLPNFIHDKTSQGNVSQNPAITASIACAGEYTSLKLENPVKDLDSFEWEFGDGTTFNDYKPVNVVTKLYENAGKYVVKYKWYLCGYEYSVEKEIIIIERPVINLGKDTTLCSGASLTLNAYTENASYIWNTGATDPSITVSEPGTYFVIVSSGSCSATDTIAISYYPEIWTALGEEYFICEEEKELAKLDAGKGFEQYLWHPTGDTSQWIVVTKTGDYYVVVKDFRGCEGQDGTIVKRKCPVYLQFPNAFSPNYDGLNDEFKPVVQDILNYQIKIYNRWGEKVFESTDVNKGWDGTYQGIKTPDGVYFYISSYNGYGKKQAFQNFHKSGYFTLFR